MEACKFQQILNYIGSSYVFAMSNTSFLCADIACPLKCQRWAWLVLRSPKTLLLSQTMCRNLSPSQISKWYDSRAYKASKTRKCNFVAKHCHCSSASHPKGSLFLAILLDKTFIRLVEKPPHSLILFSRGRVKTSSCLWGWEREPAHLHSFPLLFYDVTT